MIGYGTITTTTIAMTIMIIMHGVDGCWNTPPHGSNANSSGGAKGGAGGGYVKKSLRIGQPHIYCCCWYGTQRKQQEPDKTIE